MTQQMSRRIGLFSTGSGAMLVLLLAGACAAPLGGEDFELTAGASALPGFGATLGFSQRLFSDEHRRLDIELDWTHQSIDRGTQMGRTGNTMDLVRLGTRLRFTPNASHGWTARLGAAWLRARGDLNVLDSPGDFGGGYLGVGYEVALAEHLTTGPEVILHRLDSEGSGDSGWVPQLGWRLTWKL